MKIVPAQHFCGQPLRVEVLPECGEATFPICLRRKGSSWTISSAKTAMNLDARLDGSLRTWRKLLTKLAAVVAARVEIGIYDISELACTNTRCRTRKYSTVFRSTVTDGLRFCRHCAPVSFSTEATSLAENACLVAWPAMTPNESLNV